MDDEVERVTVVGDAVLRLEVCRLVDLRWLRALVQHTIAVRRRSEWEEQAREMMAERVVSE